MKITSREKSCRKLTGEHQRTDSVITGHLKQINASSVDCILYGIIIPENFTSLLSIKAKHVSGVTLSFKLQRACHPCRQLNSRKIKSVALCYLSPIVLGKCSSISAKCACKVQEEGFENLWNGMCRTRDAFDKALQGLFMCVQFKISSFSVVVWVE